MEKDYKKLWMRAGLDLMVTDEDAEIIIRGDGEESQKTVVDLIKNGRFLFDGNSYIPSAVIENYNRDHGTCFDDGEPEFELPYISGFRYLETEDSRFTETTVHASKLSPSELIRCQRCLRDNGIPANETATVLQALCYILIGSEAADLLDWDRCGPQEV